MFYKDRDSNLYFFIILTNEDLKNEEIEKRKIVGLLATFCLGFDLVMTVLAVLAIL